MAGIFSWNSSPSSNTVLDGINVNTGMSPGNVDNSIRSLMAVVRQSFASALETFFNGTAGLPVANGGTGATDINGALVNINALAANFRDLVPVTKGADFPLANAERASGIRYTGAAGTATIPANASSAINTGSVFVIYNGGSGALAIVRASGVTLYKNGVQTSADASLAVGGTATIVKWDTDTWVIDGRGVS